MKKVFLLLIAIFVISIANAQLTLISNPSPLDSGFMAYPIIFNNNLYFQYCNSTKKFQLAKYDGITVTLIPNPSSSDLGMTGQAVLYNNNLYFSYKDSNSVNFLAKYNDTTLSLISNINTADYGISGIPFVFNNNLYLPYKNASSKYQLAFLNGNDISLINNLNTSDLGCAVWSPIIYNNKLFFGYQDTSLSYLASYDGVNLQIIANPDTGKWGFQNSLIVYNQALYFNYHISTPNDYPYNGYEALAKFNGDSINLIGISDYGYFSPILYNNYLLIGDKYEGVLMGTHWTTSALSKWDSNNNGAWLEGTYDINPYDDFGYQGCSIIYNDYMYFINNTINNANCISKYDNISVYCLQRPDSTGSGFFDSPIVYNNKLYYCYSDMNSKYVLTKYDGTPFVKIQNSSSSDMGVLGNLIVFNNALYFKYLSVSNKYQLGKYIDTTSTVGIINKSETNISIYPNPTRDNLTIETNSNTNQRLEIVNLIGHTIYTNSINKTITINTSAFLSGVYIIKLYTDKETVVKKFVKE